MCRFLVDNSANDFWGRKEKKKNNDLSEFRCQHVREKLTHLKYINADYHDIFRVSE